MTTDTTTHPVLGEIPKALTPGSQAPVESPKEELSPLDSQVGGGHYKLFKIQPIEFTMANKLDFIQGNIVKYATRHKFKNGIEDLDKIIHYARLAKELQYKDGKYVG